MFPLTIANASITKCQADVAAVEEMLKAVPFQATMSSFWTLMPPNVAGRATEN